MVQINFARKEINCKIVYYGPGLSGKTTSLEVVHQKTPNTNKGELTSISTDGDRTLFFDFMPLDLGNIAGMSTKFHLYTVPGQVYYNSTRKLVLLGADGIIFVADSSPGRMEDNIQSMENLRQNLAEMGRDINKMPLVMQYNKRDIPSAVSVEELERSLNPNGVPCFEASAKTGEGIFQTLKAVSALVLEDINSNEKRVLAGGQDSAGVARRPSLRPVTPMTGETGTEDLGLLPNQDVGKVLRRAADPATAEMARPQAPTAQGPVQQPVAPRQPAPPNQPAALRPTPPAAAPRHAQPRQPAAAPRGRARAPATPGGPGVPQPRSRTTVQQSRQALAEQIRTAEETATRPRRSEAARRGRPRREGPSNSKLVAFLLIGILAGAVAAVVAVKFLLDLG